VLGRLWARRTIAALASDARAGADHADEITAIALAHGLMSVEMPAGVVLDGRTFASALGVAAGSQADVTGVTGSTGFENTYVVDGVSAKAWRASVSLMFGVERGAGSLTAGLAASAWVATTPTRSSR